ncbi:hypothetical protein DPSP01_008583 [Paraphaeosphaeria sporulosa]
MEHVSRIDTAREAVDQALNFADDEPLSGETPVHDIVLSDPLLQHLPFEGYRILDPQSSRAAPIKPLCDRTHSYISFVTPVFGDDRATGFAKRAASICRFVGRNWNNLLLVFVPMGIIAPELGCGDTVVFVFNCFAIVPLADVLCRATDDVSSFLGDTAGALLNVTMGNATELAIFVHALLQRQYAIVRTSLLGSIIVNMLLVLGLSILAGEIQMRGQSYNVLATRVAAGLLCLTTSTIKSSSDNIIQKRDILGISRGTSIVLIVVYIVYLWTQVKSTRFSYKPLIELGDEPVVQEMQESLELDRGSIHRRTLSYPRTFAPLPRSDIAAPAQYIDNRDLPDPYLAETFSDQMTATLELVRTIPWVRKAIPVAMMILSTCLISICGELLVGSIDHFVDHSPISKTMVGLIILPVVGNASELISGIMFAYRKQMDLAFAICIGSAIQMALLVAPLVVLLGWTLGREMSLNFSLFEAITLVASTVLFFSLVFDDRCSTIKGASLIAGYTIISLTSNFITSTED